MQQAAAEKLKETVPVLLGESESTTMTPNQNTNLTNMAGVKEPGAGQSSHAAFAVADFLEGKRDCS